MRHREQQDIDPESKWLTFRDIIPLHIGKLEVLELYHYKYLSLDEFAIDFEHNALELFNKEFGIFSNITKEAKFQSYLRGIRKSIEDLEIDISRDKINDELIILKDSCLFNIAKHTPSLRYPKYLFSPIYFYFEEPDTMVTVYAYKLNNNYMVIEL